MIEKREVVVTPISQKRQLHIYLPPHYADSQQRYPVIYMYDGHNLFRDEDATYGRSWRMESFLDHYVKPVIVVGIECAHQGNQRLEEYCPYYVESSFLGTLHGYGDVFMQWVIEELKPLIDRSYRTIPFRECTMIGGSSMGGLMALYSVIKYNIYFSKAACLSSSIGLCMEQLKCDLQNSTLSPDTRIYLSWGSQEAKNQKGLAYLTASHLEMSHWLSQKQVMTYPYQLINGRHNEVSWEKQLSIFLDYLW